MFTWTPKVVKCQIYENGVLLDLKTCSDSELDALVDAIYPLWRTSDSSAIWFDVEVYDKHHMFKEPTRTMEVAAYIKKDYGFPFRKKVSVSNSNYTILVGRKIQIQPKNVLCHKWKEPVEVAFVA